MKKIRFILFLFLFVPFDFAGAAMPDVDFTRDSTLWKKNLPELLPANDGQDYIIALQEFGTGGFSFNGSFGRFKPGRGVFPEVIDSEDYARQHIYSFQLNSTADSYIEFPEVANAGLLTVNCRSGNPRQEALFFVEKKVGTQWQHVRTMVAKPNENINADHVLRQNLMIDKAVKLRLRGASENMLIFRIQLDGYNPEFKPDSPVRLILLPDTQTYTARFDNIFRAQTGWITNNSDHINFVLHHGDITNDNSEEQWRKASYDMSIMDGNVGYTFAMGNHDIGDNGRSNTRDTKLMNNYLPYDKYSKASSFGGAFEQGEMDNTWHRFSAAGYDFLILSLEFAPRNSALKWASDVIAAHPDHNVIINTHAYMYADDKRISNRHGHRWTPSAYGLYNDDPADHPNDGEEMWDKLVSKHANILMVVSGHVLFDGTGRLVSVGDKGNKVYQMLANYQGGVIDTKNGGNGFLRIVDIDPAAKTISVRSYSPYVDAFKTDDDHQFRFENVQLVGKGQTSD